ncbi:response regulator [Longimicrobium sp.]|jgi:PleD family two-component response regulator|uniref:response regulator n=1 Tax=Longimicrobium sp. TaxID=2029185 RepID=UPI002EDA47F3
MSEILYADDEEGLRQMVSDFLRHAGHEVRLAENGTQALAEVRRQPPDMVILDYRMGRPDGLEVCRDIKADPRVSHLPVLILTAQSSIEDRLGGFEAGADDYLAKPFDPRELLARVSALTRQVQRVLDRNPTTGLAGGLAIEREIQRRRDRGDAFAVCYFDLDDFKPFADRFGFAVADQAIREAGRSVATTVEGRDAFVGHVGGDDFVAVCRPEDAKEIVLTARARFSQGLPRHLPEDAVRAGVYVARDRQGVEREFRLTRLSAAIVTVAPDRWTSLEALGERVAEAKRQSKTPGGGGIAEAEL